MKQEVHNLIQAVRDLNLELTGEPSPNCVRITDNRNVFASKLEVLQRALEVADKADALSSDVSVPHPSNNPDKLKLALDGLMRLYQLKGGNLQEASDLIQAALGLTNEKQSNEATYETLPNFAASRIKRKRSRKYRLSLVPDEHQTVTFNSLRKMHFEVLDSQALLGHTVRHLRPEYTEADATLKLK